MSIYNTSISTYVPPTPPKQNIYVVMGHTVNATPVIASPAPTTVGGATTEYATIQDLVSEGEIGGLVNGLSSVFMDGVPVVNERGTVNFRDYTIYSALGHAYQAPVPGVEKIFSDNAVGIEVTAATGSIIRTIPDTNGVDAIKVTVSTPALFYSNDDGGTNPQSFYMRVEYASRDDSGVYRTAPIDPIVVTDFTTLSPSSVRMTNYSNKVNIRVGWSYISKFAKVGATYYQDLVLQYRLAGSANAWVNVQQWRASGTVQTVYVQQSLGATYGAWSAYTFSVPTTAPASNTVTISIDIDQDNLYEFRVITTGSNNLNLSQATHTQVINYASRTGYTGNIFFNGISLNKFQKSVVFPVRGTGPFDIRVTRLSGDASDARTNNKSFWDSYAAIYYDKLGYNHSAYFTSVFDAKQFPRIPARSFEIYGIKCAIPSNYDPVTREYTGIWDGTFKTRQQTVNGVTRTFLDKRVTDNPAWVLLDLLSNDRYGLGSYLNVKNNHMPVADPKTISSITVSGTTVTATTSSNHGYITNDYIKIYGVFPSAYNGSFNIVKINDTSFRYELDSVPTATAVVTTAKAIHGFSNTMNLGGFPIDIYSLYQVAQYCDELVPTWYKNDDGQFGEEPRFTCNLYLQTQEEAYTVLTNIASIFRGMVYWMGGQMTATLDSPSNKIALFTNANVIDGVFEYSGVGLKGRHTVAQVTWNDPKNYYKQNIEYIEYPIGIERYGYNPTNIVAMGCTSRSQAHRLGKWLLYTEHAESDTLTFKTGLDGALVYPGAVIGVQDRHRAGIRLGGRISSITTAGVVTLDASITIENGKAYTFYYVKSDGTVSNPINVTTGLGTYTTITLATNISSTVSAGAIWSIAVSDLAIQEYRVISISESDEGTTLSISAILHDSTKFDKIENPNDNTEFDIPLQTYLSYEKVNPITDLKVKDALYQPYPNTMLSKIVASWEADRATSYFKIRYRINDGGIIGQWNETTTKNSYIELTNGIEEVTYDIEVYAYNILGLSSVAETTTVTVIGKRANPANVTGFTSSLDKDKIKLKWDPNTTDWDFDHYEIRYAGWYANTAGSGYSSADTYDINSGGGTGAIVRPTFTPGGVNGYTLTSGGSGYTATPTVSITGGGGTGASATASISSGSVTAITITSAGTGYTSVPTISFSAGGGTGAAATAILNNRALTGFTIVNGGSGFEVAPYLTITSTSGSGVTGICEINATTNTAGVITAGSLTNVNLLPSSNLIYSGKEVEFITPSVYNTGTHLFYIKGVDTTNRFSYDLATATQVISSPTAVSGLSTALSQNKAVLSWNQYTPSSTQLSLEAYLVYINGTKVAEVTNNYYEYIWTNPGYSDTIAIYTRDIKGNTSSAANSSVNVVDPTSPTVVGSGLEGSTWVVSWNAVSGASNKLPTLKYNIYLDDTKIDETVSTTYSLNWIPSYTNSSKVIGIETVDLVGHASTRVFTTMTVASPNAPTALSAALKEAKLLFTWNGVGISGNQLPIEYYELREGGTNWDNATFVVKVPATNSTLSFLYGIINMVDDSSPLPVGTLKYNTAKTFRIATVDAIGNVSVENTYNVVITKPSAPTGFTLSALDAYINSVWTPLTPGTGVDIFTLPIDRYEIRVGSTTGLAWSSAVPVTALSGAAVQFDPPLNTTGTIAGNKGGNWYYQIAAYDIFGTLGNASESVFTINVPSSPTGVLNKVIDNNVLLYWNKPATHTFPISTSIIKKSTAANPTFDTSTLVGEKDGGFTTVFEESSGNYKYLITAKDTAGNIGTTEITSAEVKQPPDYVLVSDITRTDFTATAYGSIAVTQSLTNVVKSNLVDSDNLYRILGPIQTTQNWESHFTSTSSTVTSYPYHTTAWTSPQSQISDGLPYYSQPAYNSVGNLTEEWDYGTDINSNQYVSVNLNVKNVSGTGGTYYIVISSKSSTDTAYGTPVTSAVTLASASETLNFGTFATNFRYIKVEIVLKDNTEGEDLIVIRDYKLKLSIKYTNDGGTGVVSTNGIYSYSVTAGGSGYTSAPVVSISGGGGTGARARATVSAGVVTSVEIINSGTGYTAAPTVSFSGGGGSGAGVGTPTYTSASNGTFVGFNYPFIDVNGITLTYGATSAGYAIYDFTDVPNPVRFRVLLFNSSGTAITGNFSWTAKGTI